MKVLFRGHQAKYGKRIVPDSVNSSSYASSNEDEDSEFDPNDVDLYDDVDEYNGERFYSSRPRRPPRDALEFVKEALYLLWNLRGSLSGQPEEKDKECFCAMVCPSRRARTSCGMADVYVSRTQTTTTLSR
jgi:hypothetical protein